MKSIREVDFVCKYLTHTRYFHRLSTSTGCKKQNVRVRKRDGKHK